MAYLHEQRAIQARKMLYMLGQKKPKRSWDVDTEGMGAAIGGAVKSQAQGLKERQAAAAAENMKKAKFDRDAQLETEDLSKMSDADYKQYLDDVSVISGKGPRTEQAMPQGINWGPNEAFGSAKARLTLNAAAANAPIGGSFTRAGAEANEKESDVLTDDFHTADNMLMQARIADQADRARTGEGQALPLQDKTGTVRPMMGGGMMGTRPMTRGNY